MEKFVRTDFRLGILQCFILLGITAGLQLVPYLNNFGYSATFTAASVLALISFLYAWFILPESLTRIEVNNFYFSVEVKNWRHDCTKYFLWFQTDTNAESRNPFSYSHIHDLIDNCYTKQTPANRLKIMLTVLFLFIALTAEWGKPN